MSDQGACKVVNDPKLMKRPRAFDSNLTLVVNDKYGERRFFGERQPDGYEADDHDDYNNLIDQILRDHFQMDSPDAVMTRTARLIDDFEGEDARTWIQFSFLDWNEYRHYIGVTLIMRHGPNCVPSNPKSKLSNATAVTHVWMYEYETETWCHEGEMKKQLY